MGNNKIIYYINTEIKTLLVTTEKQDHMCYSEIDKETFLKYKKEGYSIITSAEMDFDISLKMFNTNFRKILLEKIKDAVQKNHIIAEKRTDNKYTISVIDNNFELAL